MCQGGSGGGRIEGSHSHRKLTTVMFGALGVMLCVMLNACSNRGPNLQWLGKVKEMVVGRELSATYTWLVCSSALAPSVIY